LRLRQDRAPRHRHRPHAGHARAGPEEPGRPGADQRHLEAERRAAAAVPGRVVLDRHLALRVPPFPRPAGGPEGDEARGEARRQGHGRRQRARAGSRRRVQPGGEAARSLARARHAGRRAQEPLREGPASRPGWWPARSTTDSRSPFSLPTAEPMRVVDLSFSIRPHFRWKVAPQLVASHAEGHPLQSTLLTIGCHAYTHVDAPLHFLVDGRDIASMPVDQWVGDASVIDLTHLGANGEVTAADLDRRAGHVRAGDIVLLRTDWPKRTSIADEAFWKQGPWTGPSACKWLVDRKGKAGGYRHPPPHRLRETR